MNASVRSYQKKVGVILINVGTPNSPAVSDVRRYLREFLMDARVLTMVGWVRWLLVYLLIAPFRGPKSAKAYAKIWSASGSPLMIHGHRLVAEVQAILGEGFVVRLGMRYAEPNLESVVSDLLEKQRVDELVLAPLYPQYSSSATGSCVQKIMEIMSKKNVIPAFRIIGDFYGNSGFIDAQAAIAKSQLNDFKADHVLMSYHGLPESHVKEATKHFCFTQENCCSEITRDNRFCYRAQCFATSRLLADALNLSRESYTVAFQSRLGREPWIRPFTDLVLHDIRKKGVRRLAVVVPSFVADCLETIEEIGMRAKEDWKKLGGEDLMLIECVNSSNNWADALAKIIYS